MFLLTRARLNEKCKVQEMCVSGADTSQLAVAFVYLRTAITQLKVNINLYEQYSQPINFPYNL